MHARIRIAGAIALILVLAMAMASGCSGTGNGGPATTVPTTPPLVETTIIGDTQEQEPTTQPTEVESVVEVVIRNFAFEPATLTIPPGTTVIWTNEDTVPHLVASDPHPAHTDLPELVSGTLSPGDSYRFTFTNTGNYGYHCDLHPSMTGTIVVEE
ncbi:MAG: cupredoxin domain-containing protein [Methanomicrobiales archaeon]|nr:cupredoxin domain-containing protein [Methanomicrobiales archaeon]